MPRLIDAEELELQFDVSDEDIIAKEIIRNAPTVDAVPVSELLNLRDELYEKDQITMCGLEKLNQLIAVYSSQ
jgi:hypothetical protein